MKTQTYDLTEGSVFKGIFKFSVPLIFTNLLQNLFTITDASITGHFAGSLALGSIGSTFLLLFFFTGFIMGIGGAINVLIAFYIGKKNKDEINQMLHTSFIVCVLFGFFLSAIGMIFCPFVLKAMNTKPELINGAVLYFRIFMLVIPFMAVYNFGNAVLSAYGNTKLPLIYLSIAGLINVILDIVLIVVFNMGVAGVALATLAANIVSSALTFARIIKGIGEAKFSAKKLHIDSYKFNQLIKIGVPSGFQNCIFSFANIFIQAGVNTFSAAMVAGVTATMNGENLVYSVLNSFYVACASFIGQNLGAGNKARIKRTYFVSLLYSCTTALILGLIYKIFGVQFMRIFTTDEQVICCGLQKISLMFYAFPAAALMDNTIAANRGLGKTFVPGIIVIIGSCIFRLVWIFTVFAHFKTLGSLFSLYFFSWLLTGIMEVIYFFRMLKKVENQPELQK